MTTMEDLTKTQIILLTLLVSFVTSIATGIITASLLAEAPLSVTQTINRVVERTIEKVIPTGPSNTTNTTVKEVTVVKEEDAIISSINASTKSVVRIQSPLAPDGTKAFYALGAIVSKSGLVVSDKRDIIAGGLYTIVFADNSTLTASVAYVSDTDNLAIFKINPDASHQAGFSPLVLSTNDLKLGQSVIAVEGREKNTVGVGRVTEVNTRTEKDSKDADIRVVYSVSTDLDATSEIQGSLLLNLSGELVGIKSSNNDLIVPAHVYTSVTPMKRTIDKVK